MPGTDKEWSEADKEELACLVRKYGRTEVMALAARIPRSKPPGNRRDELLREDVEWIESRMVDGVGLKKATGERFAKRYPNKRNDHEAFVKYRKRIKNQRDKWSRTKRKRAAGRKKAEEEGRLWRPSKSPRN